jgi:hypothetical protein
MVSGGRLKLTVLQLSNLTDMFELKYKEMFAGEIYLEMTYFINVSRHLLRPIHRQLAHSPPS